MQGVEEERGKSQNKRGRQRGRAGQGKVTPHGRAGEGNSLNEAFGETWSCVRPTQDRKKRGDLLQHFEALRRSEFDQDGSLGSRGVEAVRGDAVAQAIVDVLDVWLPVIVDVSDLPPPNMK